MIPRAHFNALRVALQGAVVSSAARLATVRSTVGRPRGRKVLGRVLGRPPLAIILVSVNVGILSVVFRRRPTVRPVPLPVWMLLVCLPLNDSAVCTRICVPIVDNLVIGLVNAVWLLAVSLVVPARRDMFRLPWIVPVLTRPPHRVARVVPRVRKARVVGPVSGVPARLLGLFPHVMELVLLLLPTASLRLRLRADSTHRIAPR